MSDQKPQAEEAPAELAIEELDEVAGGRKPVGRPKPGDPCAGGE